MCRRGRSRRGRSLVWRENRREAQQHFRSRHNSGCAAASILGLCLAMAQCRLTDFFARRRPRPRAASSWAKRTWRTPSPAKPELSAPAPSKGSSRKRARPSAEPTREELTRDKPAPPARRKLRLPADAVRARGSRGLAEERGNRRDGGQAGEGLPQRHAPNGSTDQGAGCRG